jgi:hypothetical protein
MKPGMIAIPNMDKWARVAPITPDKSLSQARAAMYEKTAHAVPASIEIANFQRTLT